VIEDNTETAVAEPKKMQSSESKYPTKDFRRLFEYKFKKYDWDKIYSFVSVMAKEFDGQNLEDPTVKLMLKNSLGMFVRFSSEFCGELNGYLVTAKALEEFKKIGRIHARKPQNKPQGLHYMEHLTPVGQLTRELIQNPSLENVKKLYKKQRIVFALCSEQKEYNGKKSPFGKDFKSNRSDKQIKEFRAQYGVTELSNTTNGQ
jgi:hypothetical protein